MFVMIPPDAFRSRLAIRMPSVIREKTPDIGQQSPKRIRRFPGSGFPMELR